MCDLRFDDSSEDGGVTCIENKTMGSTWKVNLQDIAGFHPIPGGNGNRFAVATLSYKYFEAVSNSQLGMIKESIHTIQGQREKPMPHRPLQVFKHASLSLFENECELLGKGGYGKVYKVKEKATGDYYALKTIEVGKRFDREFIDSAIKEREVLVGLAAGNPFMINLHSAWHENCNVFLCLELAEAGDLCEVMSQLPNRRCSPPLAGFYIAEVIHVIRFLHARGIVYRDLKPEVLHAGRGAGGYGFAADWWAVGILFYEMQSGMYSTPFPSGQRRPHELNRMYQMILHQEFEWSTPLPVYAEPLPHMRNLVSLLLIKDPTRRLGTPTSGGISAQSGDNIKEHPYFRQELPLLLQMDEPIDLDMIDKYMLQPPWTPVQESKSKAKFDLEVYKGTNNDKRLDMFGSFDGAAAEEMLSGADFLRSLDFQ